MHLHILGICGTFMGGLALLAKEKGYQVSGSDAAVYPPMSTQLEEQGIVLKEGYLAENIADHPDQIVIGNALSRGNPEVEAVLAEGHVYQSGPQWLAEHILTQRKVIAVSGTHGKTTTTSMIAWLLESAGMNPGFLIGGVPSNFGVSARLGSGDYFVIEADEYDSAFFDKRSKFIHYHPHILVLNNLEFDHADIFADLEAIKQQFHYLLRTVPNNGCVIHNAQDNNVADVLTRGCWTPQAGFGLTYGEGWRAELVVPDGSCFRVFHYDECIGEVSWNLIGVHNVLNALAAIAVAKEVGIANNIIINGLATFTSVKRRLEHRGTVADITIYDDFAHHPTAIATTLQGLRKRVGPTARIIAVIELGSYTMKAGYHGQSIYSSVALADQVLFLQPKDANWDIHQHLAKLELPATVFQNVDTIIKELINKLARNDHVLIMSNKGFDGIHERLLQALRTKHQEPADA